MVRKLSPITLIVGACLLLTLSGLSVQLNSGQGSSWEPPFKEPASSSIGTVDMEALLQYHPRYPELEALKKQLVILEKNWLDYTLLLARQAAVDGIKSPFLEKLVGLDQSAAVQQIIEEARRERLAYEEELAKRLDEEIERRRNDIEKTYAQQAEKLQKEAKREILNRQIELAMLSLAQSEAEALLDEISAIRAKLESELVRLEDEANEELEAEIQLVEAAFGEKLAAYDGELAARLEKAMNDLYREAVAAAPEGASEVGDTTTGVETLWAERLVGEYQLNTAGVDALEAHFLKELARAKEDIEPLEEQYNKLYGEIMKDLEADIAQAARGAGLTVVLDQNQVDIQVVDITNQVLDILQGEA
ncbi:MAG: hypothetical protein GX855_03070 [Firmicutes bacterium]|nr:hypothetical protein [Bacillota bacterium]